MKKTLTILLAALLCVSLMACVAQPDEPSPESTPATTLPSLATTPTTEPVTPSMGEHVTPPSDMPDPPENDYSLPPEENPGDRNDVIDR